MCVPVQGRGVVLAVAGILLMLWFSPTHVHVDVPAVMPGGVGDPVALNPSPHDLVPDLGAPPSGAWPMCWWPMCCGVVVAG